MCGIAGVYNFAPKIPDLSIVRRMAGSMVHRGPDAEGFYADDCVALGHRRLAIIDLSDASNQPFEDHQHRYRVIFNGEIYNFREIQNQLNDYPFKSTGDAEVILAAYDKWGPDCLQLLKGMFAFVIWDTRDKILFIARDRLGVKPLYYFLNEQVLVFASEVRALLSSGLIPKKINKAAIKEFLSFQSVGFPLSAIENIEQLEAGSYLVIHNNKSVIKKYWDITFAREINFDFHNAQLVRGKIKELLLNAVKRRLISDVPLGVFLSGGIDSSAIVSLMSEAGVIRPTTFTIGFKEKEFDESEYAEITARKFDTRHTRIELKPSIFLDELTNALDSMDSPSGDGINTYVVSKVVAHHGIKVALSGIGGDELFAGYPYFKMYQQLMKYKPIWSGTKWMRQAAGAFTGSTSRGIRMRQLLNESSCSIRYFYPHFRRIITSDQMARITRWKNEEITLMEKQLINLPSSLEDFPVLSQVSIAEYMFYTQHTLLKDTDQMSMAVSLEVREPFFDHDLVEFVLAVPDAVKFPHYPKQLLVESLEGFIPDQIVHRKKQNFVFPWNIWMKKDLRTFCEARLQQLAQRDFIQGDNLLDYWNRFLQNDPGIRWMEIWLLVIFEYWMEKNGIE